MNPDTKSHLERSIRMLLSGAQRQCDEAHDLEEQALYLRSAAEHDRTVAADLQALIPAQDEEPAGIPPHVWLYRNMLTDLQALAPLGRDETNGQYAVAIDQLTDAQREIPHVSLQLDRMFLNGEIDRGAD